MAGVSTRMSVSYLPTYNVLPYIALEGAFASRRLMMHRRDVWGISMMSFEDLGKGEDMPYARLTRPRSSRPISSPFLSRVACSCSVLLILSYLPQFSFHIFNSLSLCIDIKRITLVG